MEKLFVIAGAGAFLLAFIGLGVGVKAHIRRQKRLDAQAVDDHHKPRELTIDERWDAVYAESDALFYAKWAHVTGRDFRKEDQQAAQQLIAGRRPYMIAMRYDIDAAWNRIAQKVRLRNDGPFCRNFVELEADLLLADGWHDYSGDMVATKWTEDDSRQLNELLMRGAREMKGKFKRKVGKK